MRTDAIPASLSLALALLLPGCRALGYSEAKVSFFTEPPGARVIVDKKDSGFVTPCHMALPTEAHRIELAMPGYATASLDLSYERRADVIYWRDMSIRPQIWRFPLWLNLEDTVEPLKIRETLAPGRVFVRLQRATGP